MYSVPGSSLGIQKMQEPNARVVLLSVCRILAIDTSSVVNCRVRCSPKLSFSKQIPRPPKVSKIMVQSI